MSSSRIRSKLSSTDLFNGMGSLKERYEEVKDEGDPHLEDGVVLKWSDIHYSVKVAKKEYKEILHGVSGTALPGRILAVMGPSVGPSILASETDRRYRVATSPRS